MKIFIKVKLKKFENQTNVDKDITEYHIITPKFMKTWQVFHEKMYVKCQKSTYIKWTYGLFIRNIDFLRFLHST